VNHFLHKEFLNIEIEQRKKKEEEERLIEERRRAARKLHRDQQEIIQQQKSQDPRRRTLDNANGYDRRLVFYSFLMSLFSVFLPFTY